MLEYGYEFEGPGLIGEAPIGTSRENCAGLIEVRIEVGAKIEPTFWGGLAGQRFQKRWLENAVLVMAELGPGVGEKDENRGDSSVGAKGFEKEPRVGANKMQIRESGTVAFAGRSGDTFPHQVDPNTDLFRMSRSIGGEEMSVTRANLQNEWASPWNDVVGLNSESVQPLLDDGCVARRQRNWRSDRIHDWFSGRVPYSLPH